jgi:ankyrin repeat protein
MASDDESQLCELCMSGTVAQFEAFWAKNKRANANDDRIGRCRAIGMAVEYNSLAVVKFLASKGADLHFESDGATLLNIAIVNNKPATLAWLISQRCDVNHVSSHHKSSVLYTAFNCSFPTMAKMLIDAGARITPELVKLLDDRVKRRGGKSSPEDDALRALLS